MFTLLKRLARTNPGRKLIGEVFAHMIYAIPARRLRETETLLAFYHPRPAYPFHVVLVPKQAVPGLAQLDSADTAFLTDLIAALQSLVVEFQLPAYRVILNGGEFQEFPHLHFHLVSDAPSPLTPSALPGEEGQEARGG